MRTAASLALLLVAVACASMTPVPIRAGDVCFHCRSTIAEPKLATEMFDQSNHSYKFHSVGCLAEYLREHPGGTATALFVTDYDRGTMLPAENAFFVKFSVDPEHGVEDFAAFRGRAQADSFAAASKSRVARWDAILRDGDAPHLQ